MTIHTPAHPSGVVTPQVHHHYLAWTVVVTAVILAIVGVLMLPSTGMRLGSTLSDQQKSLIEYRAYERADWAASEAYPEWKALVEFRAAEREGR
jgi:uncharacterized membrane protein YdfJ with MMPL/SSD domain